MAGSFETQRDDRKHNLFLKPIVPITQPTTTGAPTTTNMTTTVTFKPVVPTAPTPIPLSKVLHLTKPLLQPLAPLIKFIIFVFQETGIGCGTIQMRSFDLLQIQSNNYPDFYPTDDACTWKFQVVCHLHNYFSLLSIEHKLIFRKFQATDCIISAECPCFDVPSSFECIEDYLKIIDLPYHQRYTQIIFQHKNQMKHRHMT